MNKTTAAENSGCASSLLVDYGTQEKKEYVKSQGRSTSLEYTLDCCAGSGAQQELIALDMVVCTLPRVRKKR